MATHCGDALQIRTGSARVHAWPTVFGHRFYRDGELVLAPCRVEEYDEDEQQYLIKWDSTSKTKWVKRLNLCFAAEDQRLWQQRQETASRRKAAQECRARLVKYVNEVLIIATTFDYSLGENASECAFSCVYYSSVSLTAMTAMIHCLSQLHSVLYSRSHPRGEVSLWSLTMIAF